MSMSSAEPISMLDAVPGLHVTKYTYYDCMVKKNVKGSHIRCKKSAGQWNGNSCLRRVAARKWLRRTERPLAKLLDFGDLTIHFISVFVKAEAQ